MWGAVTEVADVLVTGATGLIGSHLVACLGGQADVVAVARSAREGSGPARVRWITHDLAEPALPADLPRVDTVVHLAQSRRFRDFPGAAPEIFAVNVASTAQLLDWAWRTGAARFVYASTGGVYAPRSGDAPLGEDDPVAPGPSLGYYAASKRCGELLAETYHGHLTVIVLRFFFVYGPGQSATMLIPRLIESVAQGRAVTLQGRDGLRLNPVHVDDAVSAAVRALDLQESQTVNVAGPEVLTLRRMTEILGATVGREPRFDVADGDPPSLVADTARMARVLVAPRVRFTDGVAELAG